MGKMNFQNNGHYDSDYDNEYRKIPQNKRGTYKYHYQENIGGPNGQDLYVDREEVIRPGENGVTDVHILQLQRMRDNFVYSNNKNGHAPQPDSVKQADAEWREAYRKYQRGEGEWPGEKPEANWNLSTDFELEDEDSSNVLEQGEVALQAATWDHYDEVDMDEARRCLRYLTDVQFTAVYDAVHDYLDQFEFGMDHIREDLLPMLTDRQFAIFFLVRLLLMKGKDVAELLGKKPPKISECLKEARDRIYAAGNS